MAQTLGGERFDWSGPAASSGRSSLLRKLAEQIVPPKGHKVLPTASGMLLIFIGLTIGLAAYNTENNILFAALALLLASLVLSGVVCWGNLLCARWRLETNSTYRAGEEASVSIVLENARRRFPLFCISFGLRCDTEEEMKRLYLKERLDPGETTALTWRFKPSRRMKAMVSIEDVVSSFPFGFLSKHLSGNCQAEVTIWPRRISYSRSRNPEVEGALQGRSSRRKGSSGELIGLRAYERGDAPRNIHWKVSAKQGRLIVKQNAAEMQSLFSMVVDPSAYLWATAESFETMCSLAASVAEDLFLESKLDCIYVVGGPSIRIQRVSDLEAFFDVLSGLQPLQPIAGSGSEMSTANRIVFSPVSKDGVGAFVNEIQIAQT